MRMTWDPAVTHCAAERGKAPATHCAVIDTKIPVSGVSGLKVHKAGVMLKSVCYVLMAVLVVFRLIYVK